ncbi:MAG TPA: hypothetical protein VLO29_05225 [Salegentibacter sp.]|nr:hypothetical protein [Salegentibacter sp.]
MNFSIKAKNKIVFIAILFLSLLSFKTAAQESDFILSEKENLEWLKNLDSEDLEDQFNKLKDRFVQDTAVYKILSTTYVPPQEKKSLAKRNFLKESKVRPLYFFTYKKNQFKLRTNPEIQNILELNKILDVEKISGIKVYTGNIARALYGSSGSYGVVNILIKDEATFNKMKETL